MENPTEHATIYMTVFLMVLGAQKSNVKMLGELMLSEGPFFGVQMVVFS